MLHDHHEALLMPLGKENLTANVTAYLQQYYWRDMCLFGYNASIGPLPPAPLQML